MALTVVDEARDRSGLQVGDEIAFGVLGNGQVVIGAVREIGEDRRGLRWEDGNDGKRLIYPFMPDELKKLATLLCEVAGLKGETETIRSEPWIYVVQIIS